MQAAKIITYVILAGAMAKWMHFEGEPALGHIITFLSVLTGFTITALSIIATSSFSRELYKKEDEKDNSRTLLHQLVGEFEKSAILFSSVIALILLLSLLETMPCISYYAIPHIEIKVNAMLMGLVWTLTFVSLVRFIRLLKMFGKFVIQSAKRNN